MSEQEGQGGERDPSSRSWMQKMVARDPSELHRVATPLELLFDLCFVVAVAQAAAQLHHGLAEDHIGASLLAYGVVFFAIWWAWMNFTWFASAYDTDDVPYRLTVLVQIVGVLILAAAVPRAFASHDFRIATLGYVIMRLALVAHWLRAARADPTHRTTARRYAFGVSLVQMGWIALLWVPAAAWLPGWFLLAALELVVPLWAEQAQPTAWHPHHIAERYGLLTLIVLGESVASATVAIQSIVEAGALRGAAIRLVAGGLLIFFSMWWIYFDQPAHRLLVSTRTAFCWGYGHLVIFAAIAAVGAGLGLSADVLSGRTELPVAVANSAVAVPVALYLVSVWALQVRPLRSTGRLTAAFFVAVALVLFATASSSAILWDGLVLALLVAVSLTPSTENIV